ncbi:MAG: hypothetical protein EOP04_31410, partial [Proteobacteria bacterium]
MTCLVGISLSSNSQAQVLKPSEQSKVNVLKARAQKAQKAQNRALAVTKRYRVFFVNGKVQAGDSHVASLYGRAIPVTNFQGAGTLTDDNFIIIQSPLASDYKYGSYQGYCVFLGVSKGRNTYSPLASQKEYVAAQKELSMALDTYNVIQSEINAVYAPYRQKGKAKQEAKEKLEYSTLLKTVSIKPGAQLGKVILGMSKKEVVALLGNPSSSILLRRHYGEYLGGTIMTPEGPMRAGNAPKRFEPSKIRRDRYFLKARRHLEVYFKDSSPEELQMYA